MMYQEIILFNPGAVLQEVNATNGSNNLAVETPDVTMKEYVMQKLRVLTPVTSTTMISMVAGKHKDTYKSGGGIYETPDAYGELIGSGDVNAAKKYGSFVKSSTNLANKMIETQIFMKYYCPNACEGVIPISRNTPRFKTIPIGYINN